MPNTYSAKTTIFIGADGRCVVDSNGHLTMDDTVASRATVRLRARRGEYYRDRTLGSRLHTIETIEQAEREFLTMCEEALKPLLDSGEIVRLEQGAMEVDPGPGLFKAQLLIYVEEEEYVEITGLPLGTWGSTS